MAVGHPETVVATELFTTALRGFFTARRGEADAIGAGVVRAVEELESYVLRGGKRVRPTFAWLGWLGAGGDPEGPAALAVARACAALELLHASALIHDDIIDASLTRRGFPAAHVTFAEQHREHHWSGDPVDYGTGTAILVGDLAQAWADDLIRASGLPDRAQARIGPVWSAMRTEVLCGQLLDLTAEASGAEDIASALRVDRFKTASYTVERPLHLGAAIAGADERLISAYRAFGADIGIAFQLRDDLLGVFGDPVVTGKPSGDDLREGKRTVLLATALRRADECDPDGAGFLRAKIGTDIDEAELVTIRRVLVDTGAVDLVEQDIARRTERALAALRTSGADEHAVGRLAAMAVSATQRIH
ncbi:polyprenyl synthetase family protein [Streptomyces sp. MUM 178J]|uniref:polyprenyl synthetase family protein n=1 Tax=Streptomyces sp. MUM 178J TaxID=2791991 RepID=UPI001F04B44C|nr:polyprenyl synthetase family protein [Streptomyces sp. MUM 178J]WRQ83082.1 polyprenyl synthetase family protein [Streptomyces sp. MUM 178J]